MDKVIGLRNSREMVAKFAKSGTDGLKKKVLWNEITTSLEINHPSKKISEKYGKLFGEYRRHRDLAKTSGSGKIKFIYYTAFDDALVVI